MCRLKQVRSLVHTLSETMKEYCPGRKPCCLLVFNEVSCLVTPLMVIISWLMLDFGSVPTLRGSDSDSFVKKRGELFVQDFRFNLSVAEYFAFNLEVSYVWIIVPQLFHIGPETL